VLTGEVSRTFWGGYNADIGNGKQLLWDDWSRRGFPRNTLSRAEIVLANRAELERHMWRVWQTRGYTPAQRTMTVENLEHIYGLTDWLRIVEPN
jgi:hypothetical protein